MFKFSLPPTDRAYGLPLSGFLTDPFVFSGAVFGGVFWGLTSFPFAYFTLRKLRLCMAASFVFGAVLAEILIVTPIAGGFVIWGAILVLVSALIVASTRVGEFSNRNP